MSIERESTVFLSLGSNRGNRKGYLESALDRLRQSGARVTRISSVYQTEPVDFTDQPWFLNLACRLQTALNPQDLLALCQQVEKELGRVRTVPKGPRRIDIDILFYDDRIIRRPELSVPHPALYQRRFVLVPLAEIAAEFTDPLTGKFVKELLEHCTDESVVEPFVGPRGTG